MYKSNRLVAENRLIILYLMYQMDMPLSWEHLYNFAVNDYMDYFEFQTYITEMEQNGIIETNKDDNVTYYSLTDDGEKTVNTFSLWLFILTSGIGYAYIQCVYFLSIHSIGPLKTSFFMAFSPAFTYFFSLILLKEKFDFFVLIGFIVIFTASFYFISKKEN